ncbi:MAG: histidine--tRNA ligase [Acidimicrobiales bacterium]
MATPSFQAPKGTRDILAPQSTRQRALVDLFAEIVERASFGHLMTPIFEDIGVFLRLGDSTDVVSKEMYDFEDKDGRRMALRPELTASVVRAYVQHRPALPWKVWYEGPQFRYEKPQAGRYRQFSQVGAEALGTSDPELDVELITLAWEFYAQLGLRQVRLLLNSLGDASCRPQYLSALEEYFRSHVEELSEQSVLTLEVNPLRVLDSKRAQDQAIIDGAPLMVDFLTAELGEHFGRVQAGLAQLDIPYELSPRLVRGLDYYTLTTFEFVADALDSSQNAVGGGGRYDGLAESLGGPTTPGIGFALGVDRTLMACDAEAVFFGPATEPQVFVVDVSGANMALELTTELRRNGLSVDRAWDQRSMKAQMKVADRSGARLALLVGDDELSANAVTVRDLRGDLGQQLISREQLLDHLKAVLGL